uniref:Uncharacterized protein n=1 Tax=Leersia perrieri TaxID=77586 RepID=A0A0D9XAD0_9ORYZ
MAATPLRFAPHLTRWRVSTTTINGVVRECVEHDGKPLFFRREDVIVVVSDSDSDATIECLEIGGEMFPLMKETMVGEAEMRCVEYVDDGGMTMRLTVTEEEKEVAEVDTDGVMRVVGCGSYYDRCTDTMQHVVDVQGEKEAYMLLVSVREELRRIVRVKRLN